MASNNTKLRYPTEKIRQALLFIAEQQIVLFSHLQLLLGRTKTSTGYEQKRLSVRTTNGHIKRLVELEILERKYFNYKVYVSVTKHGYEYIGCSLVRTFPTSIAHASAGTFARLWTEKNTGASWIPERSPDCMHAVDHKVDYNTIIDGQRIAIEIEISCKNKERTIAILKSLAESFETIWYFVTPKVHRWISNRLNELPEIKEKFILVDLSTL
jgi:hypothetical protein